MNKLFTMNEIILENGTIKPITEFDDFSEVIDVFKEPPFGETLTLADKLEEYKGYLEKGLALGYYNNEGKIMGYAGLMEEVEDEHASYFDEQIEKLNPFYIYGLATKSEFRGLGICTILMEVIYDIAKENGTDFIYLRINDEGSMSEHLCRKQGYQDLFQKGEVVIQNVSFERNNPDLPNEDKRRFLIMPITDKGEKVLTETGSLENGKVKKKYKN